MIFDMASIWQINKTVFKKLFTPKPTAKAATAVAASAFDQAQALLPWRNQIAGYNIRSLISGNDYEVAIMPRYGNGISLNFIRENGKVSARITKNVEFQFVISSAEANPHWRIWFGTTPIDDSFGVFDISSQLIDINSATELYDVFERYRRIGLEFQKDGFGTYRTSPSLLRQRIESERSQKLNQIRSLFAK